MFARYASDPEVTRFLSWPRHRSVADTHAFLDASEDEWLRWPAGPYLIESRQDGKLLGGTGLSFETSFRAVTGYVLARDSWGSGFATEALNAVVAVAADLRVKKIYAHCHPEHTASLRVLEKCGFAPEGLLRCHGEFPNLDPGVPTDIVTLGRVLG